MLDFETADVADLALSLALMALVLPLMYLSCFRRNKRCYDTALEELLAIQSDWYVKVLLEEELDKIVHAARDSLEDSDSEDSDSEDSDSEDSDSEDSDSEDSDSEDSDSEDCDYESESESDCDCECESDCPCEGDCGGDCACVFTESESDSDSDSDSESESESDAESESEIKDRSKKKTTVELLDEELEAVLANSQVTHFEKATPKLRRRR